MGSGGVSNFTTVPLTAPLSPFQKPKKAKSVPQEPRRDDGAVQEARRKALEEENAAKGRRATLLTGGAGVVAQPKVQRAQLLSGA